MSDSNSGPRTVQLERRSLLAAVGTAAVTGLAGCGGDSGSGDAEGDDSDDDSEDSGDPGADTPTRPDSLGGGDDCPAVPSSYSREDIPAIVSDSSVATIDVPSTGASINRGSATLRVEYPIGSVVVQSRNITETTVEDELSSELPEVTAEYDLPSGARAQREAVATSNRVDVYIPSGNDVVYVSVAASGPDNCREGSLTTIRDQMVESIQLA